MASDIDTGCFVRRRGDRFAIADDLRAAPGAEHARGLTLTLGQGRHWPHDELKRDLLGLEWHVPVEDTAPVVTDTGGTGTPVVYLSGSYASRRY
ncbi:hypothetical protein AB0D67_07295 [Streptosporangium sp. NPDC048047]|uniref:hypothetical protein n=1 Tax=Streptosporangium sp. NPDC048047 TaxID=3155748 RepID=UPI00342E3603